MPAAQFHLQLGRRCTELAAKGVVEIGQVVEAGRIGDVADVAARALRVQQQPAPAAGADANRGGRRQPAQDCDLRAPRRFDDLRGTAIRRWLLAILKTVCQEKLGDRIAADDASIKDKSGRRATPAIRQLVGELAAPPGEAIALREMIDLSCGEIAEIIGVPVTTVMSPIAEPRGLLLAARRTAQAAAEPPATRLTGGASKLTVYRPWRRSHEWS